MRTLRGEGRGYNFMKTTKVTALLPSPTLSIADLYSKISIFHKIGKRVS
jgi:hypothetical protein